MKNTAQLEINKVAHDIRGPLSNLTGFCGELESAIEELVATINTYKDQLPEDFKTRVSEILEDDINPCLRFSNTSIAKISTRLDQFELSNIDTDNH